MKNVYMPLNQNDIGYKLWNEGKSVVPTFERTSTTTGTITWEIPATPKVYDGVVILLSNHPITKSEYPIDGTQYLPSQDFSNPEDVIGASRVVAAVYGDKITDSVNVIGLEPNDVYYVSIHVVTNTLTYYTNGMKSYVEFVSNESYVGRIPQAENYPDDPSTGDIVYNTSLGIVMLWDGTEWIPTQKAAPQALTKIPDAGDLGQLVFNVNTKQLLVWGGTQWVVASTAWVGVRSQNTIGIGTDGSSDERASMIDSLRLGLGWPTMCVELKDTHFSLAIDKAVKEFRRRADNAYKRKFLTIQTAAGKTRYHLNDPSLGTDKIVDIIKIGRVTLNGVNVFGDAGVYLQDFLAKVSYRGFYDLTTLHLLGDYNKTFEMIFASQVNFEWDESSRILHLHRRLGSAEYLNLECSVERTEQDLLVDRFAENWIRDWAKAECWRTLGLIRSTFSTLPGPNGGVSMNGDTLLNMAETEFTELKRQIVDMEVGNGTQFGSAWMTIG